MFSLCEGNDQQGQNVQEENIVNRYKRRFDSNSGRNGQKSIDGKTTISFHRYGEQTETSETLTSMDYAQNDIESQARSNASEISPGLGMGAPIDPLIWNACKCISCSNK